MAIFIFIAGPIFITFFNIYMYKKKKKRIKNLELKLLADNELLEDLKKDLKQEEESLNKIDDELLEKVNSIFGRENAIKFNNRELWIGMPAFLALFCKGNPEDNKENVTTDTNTEYWYYGKWKTSHGNVKYKKQIVIVNKLVASWQDL